MIQLDRTPRHGGSAPATPGFNAVAPEWPCVASQMGAAPPNPRKTGQHWRKERRLEPASPGIPAAESTLGSHPCVALSSAQVLPEWTNRNLAGNAFAANGDNPLNSVSHARGSLQCTGPPHDRDRSVYRGRESTNHARRYVEDVPNPRLVCGRQLPKSSRECLCASTVCDNID